MQCSVAPVLACSGDRSDERCAWNTHAAARTAECALRDRADARVAWRRDASTDYGRQLAPSPAPPEAETEAPRQRHRAGRRGSQDRAPEFARENTTVVTCTGYSVQGWVFCYDYHHPYAAR